jgi:TatD DNase family protein
VVEEGLGFLSSLRELAPHPKVVAIGETGVDYHHVPENLQDEARWKEDQATAFRKQLDLAEEFGLNVVIHQRSAWEDTLAVLRPYSGRVRGVFHCFGGTPEEAADLAALGHLVSFTGIITFKNAEQVRLAAAAVSSEGYMVETDCPYLAPVPYRGKRAEPAHTHRVAEQIACVRGISLEEVATATTRTAESFFRFGR